mmetsp:Transcript_44780/g.85630  ORF Transcript_44780/g.85630 Transcript_44780/m.85630 type:complete len:366 (-) Transcript_44780:395-1492(-)
MLNSTSSTCLSSMVASTTANSLEDSARLMRSEEDDFEITARADFSLIPASTLAASDWPITSSRATAFSVSSFSTQAATALVSMLASASAAACASIASRHAAASLGFIFENTAPEEVTSRLFRMSIFWSWSVLASSSTAALGFIFARKSAAWCDSMRATIAAAFWGSVLTMLLRSAAPCSRLSKGKNDWADSKSSSCITWLPNLGSIHCRIAAHPSGLKGIAGRIWAITVAGSPAIRMDACSGNVSAKTSASNLAPSDPLYSSSINACLLSSHMVRRMGPSADRLIDLATAAAWRTATNSNTWAECSRSMWAITAPENLTGMPISSFDALSIVYPCWLWNLMWSMSSAAASSCKDPTTRTTMSSSS